MEHIYNPWTHKIIYAIFNCMKNSSCYSLTFVNNYFITVLTDSTVDWGWPPSHSTNKLPTDLLWETGTRKTCQIIEYLLFSVPLKANVNFYDKFGVEQYRVKQLKHSFILARCSFRILHPKTKTMNKSVVLMPEIYNG